MIAATPLSKHNRPNAFVSCPMPNKSTKTMEVRAMKAAAEYEKKMVIRGRRVRIANQYYVQEKRPNIPEVMQKPM